MTRRVAALTLCATLFAAQPARADSAHEAEATALFNEGARLARAKDYEHARIKFEAAANLVDSPNTWWNLAFSEYKSGHFVPALRHARKYLRSGDNNPKHLDTYEHELLPGTVAKVGQLTFDTAPDALVRIDGEDEVGRAPFADPVAVTPGKHHVEARRDQETVSADVDVAAGATVPVSLVFGSSSLRTQLETYDPTPPATTTTSGRTQAEQPVSARTNPLHVWLPVGLAVVGAASVGLGVVFTSKSNSAANDAQSLGSGLSPNACFNSSAPACSQLAGDLHSQNTDKTTSIVFYSVGGAALAGAALTWLLVPKEVSGSTTIGAPMVGPGLLGAQWITAF